MGHFYWCTMKILKAILFICLGIVIGFCISKEYWYRQGATDTVLMYDDFSHGVVRDRDGTIDFDKHFSKLRENKLLLKKINSDLE